MKDERNAIILEPPDFDKFYWNNEPGHLGVQRERFHNTGIDFKQLDPTIRKILALAPNADKHPLSPEEIALNGIRFANPTIVKYNLRALYYMADYTLRQKNHDPIAKRIRPDIYNHMELIRRLVVYSNTKIFKATVIRA